MTERTENTKRLARNTLMLYFRMFFNLLLSLITSRLVLASLGETDYGIYNVVGGVVAMFSIVTSSMSTAISRFQTYELGRGKEMRLGDVFSVSMWIQVLFALVALVLIETVGVWFLNSHMTIPDDRMVAANWVLQCVALTFVSSITVTPYSASVISHEDMDVFAWISIYETLFKFIVAILMAYAVKHIDMLVFYAILMAVSTLSVQVIYRLFCHKKYSECRLSPHFDNTVAKEIFSFAGWNFLGNGAALLSNQGVSIVLNVVFGPIVNSARGLSVTVNNVLIGFANNFYQALNPQIVKSYASADIDYTEYLLQRGTRFAFFLFFIVALPVFLEAEFLLDLWLVDVPEHTVHFVRLIIVFTVIDLLSVSIGSAQMATGTIRAYEIMSSLVAILYFLACLISLKWLKKAPESVYILNIASSFFMLAIRWICVKQTLRISLVEFCHKVYLKILLVVVVSSIVPVCLSLLIHNESWLHFIVITSSSIISVALTVLYLGCNQSERCFLYSGLKTIIRRS